MTILTLQPSEATSKDTEIKSSAATQSYGAVNMLMGSTAYKALLEFDLSSIPLGSTCTSAIISFYQVSTGEVQAFTLTVYSIAVGNQAWVEGTSGTPAPAGSPCWNALAADGAGGVTTAWAGSAGLSTAEVDYELPAIGSISGNRSDPNGTEYAINLNANRVQGWFGAINTNYGILLTTNASNGYLGASNYPTAAYRPKLVVNYTLPPSLEYVNSKLTTFGSKLVQIPGL